MKRIRNARVCGTLTCDICSPSLTHGCMAMGGMGVALVPIFIGELRISVSR